MLVSNECDRESPSGEDISHKRVEAPQEENIPGIYYFELRLVSDQENIFVSGSNILKCDNKHFLLNNSV